MKFRIYMDEDSLHEDVLIALRRAGFDCLTAAEANRRTRSDADQLAFATDADRVIFTRNTGHFSALHRSWLGEGRTHAGIIVLTEQATSVGVVERAMRNIAERFDASTIRNQIVHLLNFAE